MKATFKPKVGIIVRHLGERFVVIEIKDLQSALCRRLSTNATELIPLLELLPDVDQNLNSESKPSVVDLGAISNEDWRIASSHMTLIKSLFEKGRYRRTRAEIEMAAKSIDKSVPTIYRWLSEYEKNRTISTFFHQERSDKGRGRLSESVEKLMQEVIKKVLLKREFGTYKDVHTDLKKLCKERNLKTPGITTIRRRFFEISEKERVKSRQGQKVAKERFTPLRGSFPGANNPLDVIQIDHTPADLIIVDDVYRKPIGRPTLTIAIDVYSRVLLGFNLWLEAPSAASVGLCLHHAMLPKDKWLAERNLNASWPCYGRPQKIHTDNAKEFRGTVLGRACLSYGIDLEQRPRGQPNYGGTVERGFRTYLQKIHTLEGTTFSNTKSKFDYDAPGKATMTLKEFERWFATYITKIYHVSFHSGIQTTPLAKFQEGLTGDGIKAGIGPPERFLDEEKLRLDFLPFIERTVQEYGVLIDHIYYNDDILRARIHEMDPDNPNSARKFIFRRDPSDISVIYFWDPDTKSYKEIPYAQLGRPPASLWEVRTVIRERIANGKSKIDENLIFEGLAEMREMEAQAAISTKTARRNEQRRRSDEERRKKKAMAKAATPKAKKNDEMPPDETSFAPSQTIKSTRATPPVSETDLDDDEIVAFDDIDMRT